MFISCQGGHRETYDANLISKTSCSIDPTYLKAYYRRGSANYALGKLKEALKDFKHVVKIKPKDDDAVKKMKACEKELKAEAFIKAIESEGGPIASSLMSQSEIDSIAVESSYDGPTPCKKLVEGEPVSEERGEGKESFHAGLITLEFVHELIARFKAQKLLHRK